MNAATSTSSKDTELFIAFGCSLGESDRWWWRRIADALGQERERSDGDGDGTYQAELIIYWYNQGPQALTAREVRRRLPEKPADMAEDATAEDFIHVVLHDASSDRTWLSTAQKP